MFRKKLLVFFIVFMFIFLTGCTENEENNDDTVSDILDDGNKDNGKSDY